MTTALRVVGLVLMLPVYLLAGVGFALWTWVVDVQFELTYEDR